VSTAAGLVIDTSAAFAILTGEAGADTLISHLDLATSRLMSSPTFVELGIVMEARYGPAGGLLLDEFQREARVELVPFDAEQAARARSGWRQNGKGRHPAALNLGDCFTYGLAATVHLPVLCTGDDFARTDLEVRRP
jgi:ribonuclease VapC